MCVWPGAVLLLYVQFTAQFTLPCHAQNTLAVACTLRFFKGGKEVAGQVLGYKKKPLEEAVAKLATK